MILKRPLLLTFVLLTVIPSPNETLREVLTAHHVPVGSFRQAELAENVQGLGKNFTAGTVVVYEKIEGELLVPPIRVLKYDSAKGALARSNHLLSKNDICAGSPGEIDFVSGFIVVSNSLSPSAGCLLVLDKDLKLRKTLYGFGPVEVAPGLIIFVESMVHFAPYHAERLQLADLRRGTTRKIYPSRNDTLRAMLIAKHAGVMPPQATCQRFNDPCDPELFDEIIVPVRTDGRGRFAFIALQSVIHAVAEDQVPDVAISQAVFYVYAKRAEGWRYCERSLAESEAKEVSKALELDFAKAAGTCIPNRPAVPVTRSPEKR